MLVTACLFFGPSLAQAQTELKAGRTAIACTKAENLKAAEEAQADRAKLDRLGCFPVPADTPARRLDGGKTEPAWRVMLAPDTADAMEVWARPSSFRE